MSSPGPSPKPGAASLLPPAPNPGRTLLVCFAVKEEAAPFRNWAGGRPGIDILLTGMGAANAERAIRPALAAGKTGLVLSAGFAGGLRPDLASGTVLFAGDAAPDLAAALQSRGALPGRFCHADRVASTAEEKRALRAATGADAVEMESQIIGRACRERGIPCAIVRVILDTANENLPLDFNKLMTPDLRLDGARLALQLIKSPGRIPALMALRRQSRAVAQELADALAAAALARP